MAKKRRESKSVTFRLPAEAHELLTTVADLRGLDLTALLNLIISDASPGLRDWLAEQATPSLVALARQYGVLFLSPREMALLMAVHRASSAARDRDAQVPAVLRVLEEWGEPDTPLGKELVQYVCRGLESSRVIAPPPPLVGGEPIHPHERITADPPPQKAKRKGKE